MKAWNCLTTCGSKPAVWVLAACCAWLLPAPACAEDADESDAVQIAIAPPRQDLVVGERLEFRGRWLALPVGRGWIEVKERAVLDGRPVYHVQAEGESTDLLSTFYPIHDVIHSYLDVETLQPVRFEKNQREGHYRAEEIVAFDYGRLVADYRSLLHPERRDSTKTVPITRDMHDIVSAFYWLRRQTVTVGRPMTVDIYSDEKIFPTEILPVKGVQLELRRRGTFGALLIEPKPKFKGLFVKRGRVWVYFSADAKRLPLYARVATPWGPMSAVIERDSLNQP